MSDERPVLDQVNLVVADTEAAAAFYALLGLRLEPMPPEWAPHHRNMTSGGADLDLDSPTFAAVWNAGWRPGATGVVLGFRVATREAVDELYDELVAAGHRGQQPPYDAFWGSRFAVVEDPDGNAVGLLSPPDDEHRTAPPPLPR